MATNTGRGAAVRREDVRKGGTVWSIGHRSAPLDSMRSADAAIPDAGEPTPTGYAALRTWLSARDAVLRGLVHALSNRVGTVIAAGGLLEAGSADVAGRVLAGEADRLERLLEEFRLVTMDPLDDSVIPEPVVLADAMREAMALHGHASEVRDVRAELTGVDDAPPLIVARAALTHALLVLCPGAQRMGVTVSGDFVALRVEPAITAEAAQAVAWLLRPSGARVDDGQVVQIPRFGTAHAPAARP